MRAPALIGAGALVLLVAGTALTVLDGRTAPALLLASLAVLLLGLAAWERGPAGAKELALVASYAAAAAAGRVLFAGIPSVQPVTVMTACAGAALGARNGAAVGAAAALLSNGFLGQGPWTPWQMLGWGLVGATAAPLAPLLGRRLGLAAFTIAWGFAYGALLDVSDLALFGPTWSVAGYLALWGRGLPFDLAHALGNAVIALVAGPALLRLLERVGRRLTVEIEWEGPGAATTDARAGRP